MARPLVTIALGSIAISAVCLSVATLLFNNQLRGNLMRGFPFGYDSCEDEQGTAPITRNFRWNGGDRVQINGQMTMHYRPGDGMDVIARGDAGLLDGLRVRGRRIELDCNPRQNRVEITLPGTPFEEFELDGSGDLILEALDQPSVEIAIHGSGDINASGNVRDVEVTIAGSGDADLGGLRAGRLKLNIMGSGDAEVSPEDEAEINIAGSGEVRLLTRPRQLKTNIAGSGEIINADGTPP